MSVEEMVSKEGKDSRRGKPFTPFETRQIILKNSSYVIFNSRYVT